MLIHEEVTHAIIAAFYAVYDELGYGFLEGNYSTALACEFAKRGIPSVREASIRVYYKGTKIGYYKADFLVAGRVVVEVKSTERIGEPDIRQLRNYLRATNLEVGLLLHFGAKPEFRRFFFENSRKRSLPAAS